MSHQYLAQVLNHCPVKISSQTQLATQSWSPGTSHDVDGAFLNDAYVQPLPRPIPIKKRSMQWTPYEHRLFLIGLEKYGKGNWKDIAKNCVKSRTATQVASHAQKCELSLTRQNKKRKSIHDKTLEKFNQCMDPQKINRLPPTNWGLPSTLNPVHLPDIEIVQELQQTQQVLHSNLTNNLPQQMGGCEIHDINPHQQALNSYHSYPPNNFPQQTDDGYGIQQPIGVAMQQAQQVSMEEFKGCMVSEVTNHNQLPPSQDWINPLDDDDDMQPLLENLQLDELWLLFGPPNFCQSL